MKIRILLFFLLVTNQFLLAQKDYIGVNSMAIPPFSNRIDELVANTNITTFLLNKTNQSLSAKFFMAIKKDGNIVVKTTNSYAMANPLYFAPNENKMIDFSQFGSLKESDIEILPEAQKLGLSKADLIRSRKLPEGNYEICLSFFDFTGQDQDQWNLPDIGCARMELSSYEVPQIIDINGKNCGEKIQATNPQFVSISWLKPAGFIGLLEYEIEMVEVFPNNREYNDAIFTSTKPNFLNEQTSATIFVINLIHQPLKQGARYVFRVKAIDPNGNASFRNNGYSQVCSFVYGDEPEEVAVANMSSSFVYPNLNDTVPFANVPMLLKWSPYFQHVENLKCQYAIKENQQLIREFIVDINCQSGMIQYLKTLNGGLEVNENVATQIILGKYGDSALNQLFQRGKEYAIDVKLDFKYKNNPVVQTVNNQTVFTYGMPAVGLKLLNNMPDTGNLNFEIGFINKPEIPLGNFNQVEKLIKAYQFDSVLYINEMALIEFSPTNSFDSIWYNTAIPVNKKFNITNPAVYLLTNSIYDNIPFTLKIKETGNWFARVKWLKSTTALLNNTESYYTSSIYNFTLGDSVDRSSTNCLAGDCQFPPVAMNQRIPLDSLKTGMKLKIGHHVMLITKVNGNAQNAPYSGEGVIKINPFPGLGGIDMPVKVKFNGIRFKSDLRVYQGKAETVDGSGLFNEKNSAQIASFLADSNENKSTIKTFIQNAASYTQNQINEDIGMPMPIGFSDNKYAGTTYKIAIASVLFTPENALMNIALGVNNATLGSYLDFFAQDVCLRSSGLSVSKLLFKSIGNKEIEIGSSTKLVILGASQSNETKSHIEWDCNGFKNFNLQGFVQISRDVLLHELKGEKLKHYSADSSVIVFSDRFYRDSALVQAGFNINIKSWNDFVVDLGIEKPFQIVGLPNWSFKTNSLTFDLSSSKNANSMSFPEGYQGVKSNEWQGLYIKDLEVKTPKGFQDKTNETERLKFNIQNLLIDRTGVSVYIRNNNLLPIQKGKFDDWAVAVDLIEIKVLSNAFQYGKIDGKLRVPLDSAKDFGYSMMIDYQNVNNNSTLSYSTTVSTISQLDVPMWKAKFSILPNSHAKFFYNSNDSFYAELKLNGFFGINADVAQIKEIEFAGIPFQDLILRSSNIATEDSTYFTIGHIGFDFPGEATTQKTESNNSQKKAGGFPVNFKDFKMIHKNEIINGKSVKLVGLQINLDLDLSMGKNAFVGSTRMKLWAKPDKQDGILGYKYHEFEVDSISIDGKISVVEVQGNLVFYKNHSTYGDGLKGNIDAQFTPGLGFGALAYFGNVTKNGKKYDYWGVFGSFLFPTAVPLGGLEIAGFGGGAYNNMKMVLDTPIVSSEVRLNSSKLIPILEPYFGEFGFRATVFAQSTGGGSAWKAALSLGAVINKEDFALNSIIFTGNMWIMAPPEKGGVPARAAFWAGANIIFDFRKPQFDGNFTFYVNKEIAKDITLTGYQGEKAGEILMHFSSLNKWYVYVGQPSKRCGIKLSSPAISLSGYFVSGTEVPPIPDLPDKIRNELNIQKPVRNEIVKGGAGFGFGAEFSLNTGEKKFLFMSASLDLLVGFDMSLMKYENASCDGITTRAIGIDGWYAQGQLYAFAEGKINANIDVWFYEGKVEIMNCKAGLLLQGAMPNPSWMYGAIGGSYRLFNGAIKGKFNFDVEIGDRCQPALLQNSPVENLEIVSDVKPSNNASGIDIFERPEILCNFKLAQEIAIDVVDNNGKPKTRVFRPKLKIVLLKKASNSNAFSVVNHYTQSVFDDDFENLTLYISNNLPFETFTEYKLEITEFFEEKINNVWAIAKDKSNNPISRVRVNLFNTGGAPLTIDEKRFVELTPAIRENFFMKDVWNEQGSKSTKNFRAEFKFNLKQLYFIDSVYARTSNFLFTKTKAKYVVRFTNVNNANDRIEQPVSISGDGMYLNPIVGSYKLDALKNQTLYKLEIIRMPANSGNTNQNALVMDNFYTAQYINKLVNPNFEMQVKKNTFKADYKSITSLSNEFVLFSTYFNVSQFNNMKDKVAATKIILNLQQSNGQINYATTNSKNEPFDEKEWNNQVWLKDIIQSGVNWYKTYDSIKLCMDYLSNYQNIAYTVGNISGSKAATINNSINCLNAENTSHSAFPNQLMWNIQPLSNTQLIKDFTDNTLFLAASRSRSGQNFVSRLDYTLSQDRIIVDNNIIQVIATHNQVKSLYNMYNVVNPSTGPGNLMPNYVLIYLTQYLNGRYVPRKTDGLSYHKISWVYKVPNFNTQTKQIDNYKISSLINQ